MNSQSSPYSLNVQNFSFVRTTSRFFHSTPLPVSRLCSLPCFTALAKMSTRSGLLNPSSTSLPFSLCWLVTLDNDCPLDHDCRLCTALYALTSAAAANIAFSSKRLRQDSWRLSLKDPRTYTSCHAFNKCYASTDETPPSPNLVVLCFQSCVSRNFRTYFDRQLHVE